MLVLIFALSFGCSRGEGKKAFDKGNRLMKSGRPGDLERSIVFFKKSIELEMRARNQLVSAYKRLARKKIAEAGWSMKGGALEGHVKSRAAAQAGVSAISLRLFHTAVDYLKKALKHTPNDKFIHFHLGVCHAQLSLSAPTLGDRGLQKQQAAAAYKTSMRLDPNYSPPAYGLALLRMSEGKFSLSPHCPAGDHAA